MRKIYGNNKQLTSFVMEKCILDLIVGKLLLQQDQVFDLDIKYVCNLYLLFLKMLVLHYKFQEKL